MIRFIYIVQVRNSYTSISDEQLHAFISEILHGHPSTGYKRMRGFLLERGVKVTDVRVRLGMRIVDPIGVYQRTAQNRAIVRRKYYVKYSNQLWHLDTNMKLIRYKHLVHIIL